MKETVPLTETLFHCLLEEKGKRLQTLQILFKFLLLLHQRFPIRHLKSRNCI